MVDLKIMAYGLLNLLSLGLHWKNLDQQFPDVSPGPDCALVACGGHLSNYLVNYTFSNCLGEPEKHHLKLLGWRHLIFLHSIWGIISVTLITQLKLSPHWQIRQMWCNTFTLGLWKITLLSRYWNLCSVERKRKGREEGKEEDGREEGQQHPSDQLFAFHIFCSVQSLSRVWLFVTPWTAARQASLSIINSQSLLKLMFIESVMPSNHLILCHPLLLMPSIFPSIRVFSNESVLRIRWPKDWTFSFLINPSNEYSGLISFRTDWFDLLAVQGILKRLLQHHGSKAANFWHSAFLMVQLSHPYITTEKTIALTRWTFAGKVMSLLFKCCLGWS